MLDEQDFPDKGVDKDSIITYLTSFYHILGEGDVSNSGTDQAKGKDNLTTFYSIYRKTQKRSSRALSTQIQTSCIQKGITRKGIHMSYLRLISNRCLPRRISKNVLKISDSC
jgi:hypothetical protein